MVTPPCARDGYGVDFLNLERMKISEVKITDIIQDDKNLNKGTADGKAMITKSLQRFGAGRSILLDKNNRIIAGNKTHENAEEIGMEDVIVVESDGSKLVAVKRTDIDLDSKEGREMALADNATVKVDLSWDDDAMREVSETWGIDTEEWGVELETNITESPKDVSEKFDFEYKLEINCINEREQEKLYNEMQERGYECRLLTL